MHRTKTYGYNIPVNEQEDGGTITMLRVQITDDNPVRRGALVRRVLRDNYNLSRHDAKVALRAMEFGTLVT